MMTLTVEKIFVETFEGINCYPDTEYASWRVIEERETEFVIEILEP